MDVTEILSPAQRVTIYLDKMHGWYIQILYVHICTSTIYNVYILALKSGSTEGGARMW